MLLLYAVRSTGAGLESLGEKASRQLVTVTGRIQELTELGEPLRGGSDLLGELARRAQLRWLTGDVELSCRQLEQRLVDRPPVLTNEQHVLTIALERYYAYGCEGPHNLAFEGEPVRAYECAHNHPEAFARVPQPLADLAKRASVKGQARRDSRLLRRCCLPVGLRRGHCRGRRAEECARAPG